MKKTLSLALAGAAIALACACSGSEKPQKEVPAQTAAPTFRVAYINLDSLQAQYAFYKQSKETLEAHAKQYQSAVQQKEKALIQLENEIKQRMQGGQITSEAQYKQEMQKYESRRQAYAQFRESEERTLAEEQTKFSQALQDSLDHFLAEYNRTKKFTLILNNAVVLQGDPALDITAEVAAGMNKRYKK